MYPIPPWEHLVENRKCKQCVSVFPITDKDMGFYEKVSPSFGGKKYRIPPPTLCPDCRQQRRLAFRNERKLYKRKCDATGKEIVSMYSPNKPYTVYHQDHWWSDAWDPMDYGREFDFEKSAFEQFGELRTNTPEMNLVDVNTENSPFANYLTTSKNIYLSTDLIDAEDVYYSNTIKNVKRSLDVNDLERSENCYECVSSQSLFNCLYVSLSQNCQDSIGLHNCKNCKSCLFSINLRDQEYYIFNEKYTKEYYEIFLELIKKWWILLENLKRFNELKWDLPQKNIMNIGVEDCIWNNLQNSTHCFFCFDAFNIEQCKYSIVAHSMINCMDTTIHNPECEWDYEAISGWKLIKSQFNTICWECDNITYSHSCFSSSHLFLCIWIRNKSYCILNRQYTKEEYEELVPRIIEKMMQDGEWWEFFPASLSPFGYNETVAQEYFPLKKEEALKDGIFNWSDYEAPFPQVEKIIPASKLPDTIESIPDDILNWAIECEVSGKPFRIIKQELEFYRKHNLPIPRRHPDVRHMDRMKMRNPRKLFERKCDKCRKDMITTYAPERKERVYCGECYDGEVIG